MDDAQTDAGGTRAVTPDPGPDSTPDPTPGKPPRRRGPLGCVVEIVQTVILTLVIFFAIQWFVAQPFKVEMFSMETTFEPGDYVLIDKLSPHWDGYSRGDVVVFSPPKSAAEDPTPFIKRVIGEPGDTVEVRDDGFVWVNGVKLDEPYLFKGVDGLPQPTLPQDGNRWVVPAGDLFVMGDHRMRSADSRSFGPIPIASVIGRGAMRYWPITAFKLVTSPVYADVPAP